MPARLAQHLVGRGLLREETANEALRRQAIAGGTLDTVLLEQGALSEVDLLNAQAEVGGHRAVNLAEFEPNHEVAHLIPPKIAERLVVVPLSVDGGTLHVACAFPVPKTELDEVAFLLGKQLVLWVAIEARVREWISVVYGVPLPARYTSLLAQLDPNRAPPEAPAPKVSAPPPRPPPEAVSRAPAKPPPPPADAVSRAPAKPPPPPPADAFAELPVAPKAAPEALRLVEELTLEESLNAQMVERIARAVAEEPIPLEVRKAPKPVPPPKAALVPEPPEPPVAEPKRATKTEGADRSRAPTDREIQIVQFPPSARTAAKPSAAPPPATPEPPPPAIAPPAAPPPEPSRLSEPVKVPVGATALSAPLGARDESPPAPEAPDPVRQPPPDWTLAQARTVLKGATDDREHIIEVALSFGRRAFEFIAAFAVIRGSAIGWDVRGEQADRPQVQQVSIPLDSPSVFRTVALTRGSYAGPVPADALSGHFLGLLGRQPRTVFLYPVEVKQRLVAILYGDCGQRPMSQLRLSDYTLFCQDLPSAFQELILHRKQRGAAAAFVPLEEERVPAPAPVASAASSGFGWSAFSASSLGGLGRAASMSAPIVSEGERPPPDFGPLLRKLTGPDASQRSRAMAELARSPEASAAALTQQFPGPTAWSRLPVVELPEADELGPIPGALSRLGRAAAQAIAPLLDSDDSDTRYLALLTAGNLPFPELVDGVLRGLFDFEPDISSAARAAATSFKRVARFDSSLKGLRQELASRDALRRALAARALGVLHDREAIDGLIGLTGSDDAMTGQAAAEALREITRATFGTSPRAWTAWWAENRARRRIEWLVGSLRHVDVDIRQNAIEELSRVTSDALGFDPEGAPAEREAAVRKWEQFLATPRGQKLDV